MNLFFVETPRWDVSFGIWLKLPIRHKCGNIDLLWIALKNLNIIFYARRHFGK
jgi:hypothetical protein